MKFIPLRDIITERLEKNFNYDVYRKYTEQEKIEYLNRVMCPVNQLPEMFDEEFK